MVLGVVAKIGASYFRYTTLVSSYKGVGDASDYDNWGRQFAQFWMGNGPEPYLPGGVVQHPQQRGCRESEMPAQHRTSPGKIVIHQA